MKEGKGEQSPSQEGIQERQLLGEGISVLFNEMTLAYEPCSRAGAMLKRNWSIRIRFHVLYWLFSLST